MNGCEGFEIAIEMRLHGAADRQASESLDAHLATCEACRRFEIEVKTAEKTMREGGSTLEGAFDATRMRERIRRAQRNPWITPLLVAAGFFSFIVLAALDAWIYGVPFVFAKYPRVILLFAAVTALFVARSAQTVFALWRAERRGDLLPALRKNVGRRLRAAFFANIVVGSLGLFHVVLMLLRGPERGIGEILFVAALLGGALYGFFVSLPRLRRERAELA